MAGLIPVKSPQVVSGASAGAVPREATDNSLVIRFKDGGGCYTLAAPPKQSAPPNFLLRNRIVAPALAEQGMRNLSARYALLSTGPQILKLNEVLERLAVEITYLLGMQALSSQTFRSEGYLPTLPPPVKGVSYYTLPEPDFSLHELRPRDGQKTSLRNANVNIANELSAIITAKKHIEGCIINSPQSPVSYSAPAVRTQVPATDIVQAAISERAIVVFNPTPFLEQLLNKVRAHYYDQIFGFRRPGDTLPFQTSFL